MDARDRGRFVWHELNTTDPAAAERFYRSITGWGMMPFDQMPSYRMWTADGVPQGGLMLLPEQAKKMGAPPHWLSYVGVPDVDASVRLAASLGARTYVPPQDIPGAGRFAVLGDPQGAVFAVHSPGQQMGAPEEAPKVGEFSWHELATTDRHAAWSFYETLFGWKKLESMETPMGPYQMFGRGSFMYGGIYTKPPEMPAPPHWLAYISVPSVDIASPKVTAQGGKILAGPMNVPGGDRIVMCMDPQGAAFALHSKAAAPAPAGRRSAGRAATASKPAAKRKSKKAATPKRKAAAKPKRKAAAKPKKKVRASAKKRAGAKKAGAKKKTSAKRSPSSRSARKAKKKSPPKAKARRRAKGKRRGR